MTKYYQKLEQELRKINHLNHILGLAYWDSATYLPKGSATSRNQEIATMSTVIHHMSTSEHLGNLISEAETESAALTEWQRVNVLRAKKNYQSAICISDDLQSELTLAAGECEFAWRKARAANDFKSLVPHLDRVLSATLRAAEAKSNHFGLSPYDALVDDYDPERKSEEIKSVFAELKSKLPSLVNRIMEKQAAEKVIPLSEKIDENTQKAIGMHIASAMGFNFDYGRLDKSAHPFCSGSNDDVRLTTRYDENNFISGLFAVIHEAGHGLYQQNLPKEYRDQPVGMPKGMAFHESQSIIMEVQAATTPEFTTFLAKVLRDEFSLKGPEYAAENIYKLMTRVEPSLIRVDADEVTYPLHVILRFEIEQEIIAGNVTAADLPALWNAKMKEYLGIVPDSDSNGCMQDIHWHQGSLGYFPCYVNGAIIASMLMKAATKAHPGIKSELSSGNFATLNNYLTENLRGYGSLKDSSALLAGATGEGEVNPTTFINYLEAKYI